LWKVKINKNIFRDKQFLRLLKKENWIVKTIWESEIEENLQKILKSFKIILPKV